MGRNTLLLYHTHTPDSNRFEADVRGHRIGTHATDYASVVEELPTGRDAVFVKTDHWATDPAYFERLRRSVEAHGGSFDRFEAHACFRVSGSRGVVINGVEASVDSERFHVTICGLPTSDTEVYKDLTPERLLEVGRRAAWIAPAHVGLPFHRIPRSLLADLLERAAAAGVTAALGYPTGYPPLYNRIARNEVPLRTPVTAYAREYGVPLLPELDLHGTVPDLFSGCGVVNGSATNALFRGRMPTEQLLDADLLRPPTARPGIPVSRFLRDYASFVPFLSEPAAPDRRFRDSIPDPARIRSLDLDRHSVALP